MSTKAILKIDGKYYNLLNVTYAYRRFTDYSGYVSNLIRFEKINIVISNPADTFFLQWMFNPTLQKSGTISFYDEEDMAKKVKEIVFAGAYCIEYEEKFQSTSGNPFHAFVTLSAGGVKVEESTFRFPWFKGPLIASNDSPIEAIVVEYLQNEESPINVPLQGITHTKNIATNNTPKTSTKAPVSINFSKGLQDKIGELNPTSQTLLSKDLSENVDLLKSLEDNHDLVDSWKVLDSLGEKELKNDIKWCKRVNHWSKSGVSLQKNVNNFILTDASGNVIGEYKNGNLLPEKYANNGTPIGDVINGYQLVDNNGTLSWKREPDKSQYNNSELNELTQHMNAHILERHGHDVTDDALIKRANRGIAPDGSTIGNPSSPIKPPYSSRFETSDQLKSALNNTRPGTIAFNAEPTNNGTKVVTHTLTDGTTYGKGVPKDGNTFVQSIKVRAVYREVSPNNFQLLTMFPDF